MPEEILEKRPKRRPAWEVVVGVIIGALLFGAIGYLAGSKNTSSTSDSAADTTETASDTATSSTSATATADVTANWKTYTNDQFGFSLKYPSDWNEPKFTKTDNFGDLKGSQYATWTGYGSSKLDPLDKFSISFNTTDYQAYDGKQITKTISTDWTKSEFEANISNLKPSVYKKLSQKALLVGHYSNVECSQTLSLNILSPLSSNYPNLIISINNNFDNDETIKAAEAEATRSGTDICNQESAYDKIAAKVQAGIYSDDLEKNINIAKLIADSLTLK